MLGRRFVYTVGILSFFSMNVYGYELIDGTVLKLDMTNDILMVSNLPVGDVASVKDHVENAGATAGINASYFCPNEPEYSYCGGNNTTTAESIVQGTLLAKYGEDTGARGVVGVDNNNQPLFVQNNFGYVPGSYEGNTNKERYKDLYYAVGNFPILLDNGVDITHKSDDVIDTKMKAKAIKNFICISKDSRYMYMGFVNNKTIYEMADYLRTKYSCHWAVNLDSGGSSAMYVDGKYIVGPGGRNVPNALVVKSSNSPITAVASKLSTTDLAIAKLIADKNYPLSAIESVLTQVRVKSKTESKFVRVVNILVEVLRLMKL